jgi:DNA-binding transcriptional LysR family regulator
MDMRHLKIFAAVCDHGNMTRAAEALYMTQPSVSQVIAELEKEYGVRLFERLNHRLYLTEAGERLRIYARQILNLSEQARKELADLDLSGSIRVGASLTVGAHLLPALISGYRLKMPQVEIFTQVDNTGVIERMLLEDTLDLGIVEGPVNSPQVAEEMLCDDALTIICGPSHPLWGQARVELAMLAGQGFIIRERGSGTRDLFERVMEEAGASWKIAGVYNNTEAIKNSVRANLGMAVVPQIAVEQEVSQGLLQQIDVQGLNLKRKFNLIYHHQKFFTRAIQAFFDFCRRQYPLPG